MVADRRRAHARVERRAALVRDTGATAGEARRIAGGPAIECLARTPFADEIAVLDPGHFARVASRCFYGAGFFARIEPANRAADAGPAGPAALAATTAGIAATAVAAVALVGR